MHRNLALAFGLTVLALGCGTPVGMPTDAGRSDAAMPDAFVADGGTEADAAVAIDAAHDVDAAAPDAAVSGCAQQVTDIETAAANVWFLSESDRPLEVHVFPGEGASAPTESDVVRLAASPAAATRSTRTTDGFAMHFEPAPGATDGAPAILEAAIAAGLTDTIYVAIIEDPTASAEVRAVVRRVATSSSSSRSPSRPDAPSYVLTGLAARRAGIARVFASIATISASVAGSTGFARCDS